MLLVTKNGDEGGLSVCRLGSGLELIRFFSCKFNSLPEPKAAFLYC